MQKNCCTFENEMTRGLNIYKVGGAIRDSLLGLPVEDSDWVVVGSNALEMERRGFISVGNSFPVFLHPITKEEYALARTERKFGYGYRGFIFFASQYVTLTEDLMRRDLTINAIACSEKGELIDPFNGIRDIEKKVLRHVSLAFQEDPVRILRLARFSSKFFDFSIAKETLELCKKMVRMDEIKHLKPERIWKEISRGLLSEKPSQMFSFLQKIGALSKILPELNLSSSIKNGLDKLSMDTDLPTRYAFLCFNSQSRSTLHFRLNVPSNCAEYANLLPRISNGLNNLSGLDNQLSFMEDCDALRRPDRFFSLLKAYAILENKKLDIPIWINRIDKIRKIDFSRISIDRSPGKIKSEIRKIRLKVLGKV